MVGEVVADSRKVDDDVNVERPEKGRGTDAGKLEELYSANLTLVIAPCRRY